MASSPTPRLSSTRKQSHLLGRLPIGRFGRRRFLDDRAGLAGLKFVERLNVGRNIPTDRYSFRETGYRSPHRQRFMLRTKISKFGRVIDVDLAALTIDMKKTKKSAEYSPEGRLRLGLTLPSEKIADALLRTGDWMLALALTARVIPRRARLDVAKNSASS